MNELQELPDSESDWPRNYFNYFTEIEECFQRARGTGLFLMSPLDWALIESWKNAGVPLESALKGIDEAFEKWRSRKQKRRLVNSLAYCTQSVMEVAQRTPASRARADAAKKSPFSTNELASYLTSAAAAIRQTNDAAFTGIAEAVEELISRVDEHAAKLEDLERHLSTLEEKLVAIARTLQTDEDLYTLRVELDRELNPYRGKMNAEQLAMLERRYLDTAVLDRTRLPRLSLFYLH